MAPPAGGGWGGPAPSAPSPTRPALPAAPVLVPQLPAVGGPYRIQPQRSLAEMANEQLRRQRKDPLAAGVEDSAVDDCLKAPRQEPAAGGLLNAPAVVARALAGRCPK